MVSFVYSILHGSLFRPRSPLEGPVVQRKGCSLPVLPIELFLKGVYIEISLKKNHQTINAYLYGHFFNHPNMNIRLKCFLKLSTRTEETKKHGQSTYRALGEGLNLRPYYWVHNPLFRAWYVRAGRGTLDIHEEIKSNCQSFWRPLGKTIRHPKKFMHGLIS